MRNKLLILILFAALFSPVATRAQTVILRADSVTIPCHAVDTFLIPVRVYDFVNVAGLQFTLSWNPSYLDYIHVADINPLFSAGIGLDSSTYISQGKITFSWTDPEGLDAPDTTILMRVAFTRTGGPATLFEFTDTPTDIYAIDSLGNDLMVEVFPGLVTPIDTIPPSITCPDNVSMEVFGPTAINNIAPLSVLDNCATQMVGWTSSGATTADFPNDPDASGGVFNVGQSTVTYQVTDVGGNTASCSFQIDLSLSLSDSLTIIASNETTSCGQTVTVDITALNFDSLAGLQFSLGWNTAVLNFDTFLNFNPALDLTINNFGNGQTGSGFLGFAWTTSDLFNGTSLANGEVLFSISFTVVGGSNSSSGIVFGNIPTDQVAFTISSPDEIGFLTVNGSVTVADMVPPVITCPANVSVTASTGGTSAPVNGLEPLVLTDNCSGNVGLSYLQSGATTGQGQGPANGTYNAGTTTVVYTAADASGNTSTCSFTVIVDAGTPLTLQLDTVSIDCQSSGGQVCVDLTVQDFVNIIGLQFDIAWDTSVLKFETVTNQYPGLNLTSTMFFSYNTTPAGVLKFFGGNANGWPDIPNDSTFFTICFTVKNANGSSNIAFTNIIDAVDGNFNSVPVIPISGYFQSTDFTPPVPLCPMDTVVNAFSSECNANVMIGTALATDACSGIKSITNDQTDDIYPSGVTTVTFTVEDNAGNTSTCSFTVTVQDNLPPELFNCPVDMTVNAAAPDCNATATWQPPLASDNCNPNVPPQLLVSTLPGSTFPIGDSVVVYTAIDLFGDSATCSFTVSVIDTVFPVIICPGDITVYADDSTCSATAVWSTPLASDNCDLSVTIQGDTVSGASFNVGQTAIHYSATDDYGNTSICSFFVTVLDLSPPVLDSCPADMTLAALPDSCGAFATWTPPGALDDCTPDVSVTSMYSPGDYFPVGTTVVEYTAADVSNNSATCSFSVTVTETVPPSIVNCPVGFVFIMPPDQCDTVVTWTPPTATDNCALDTITSTDLPGATFSTGSHVVTYTAIDLNGNTATCAFVVEVKDNVPPVFNSCPENITVQNASPCGEVVDWLFPTASDNCVLDTIISTKIPTDTIYDQITNVVIRAYDASGNSDTCQFTITLDVVIIPPSFNNFPADVTLNGCPQAVDWTPPTEGVGFCTLPEIRQIPDTIMPGDTFPVGVTQIVYAAFDTTIGVEVFRDTFTITIIEDTPPEIACPTSEVAVHVGGVVLSDPDEFISEIESVPGCDGVLLYFGLPSATDNCGDPLVVQTTGAFSGFFFSGDSTHTLTFQAADAVGNTAVCIVRVQVVGLQALDPQVFPPVACPGDEVVLVVDSFPGAIYTWTGPSQSYPNNSRITVIASQANAGLYTVSADINGCITPVDSAQVVLASDPLANDDLDYLVDPGGQDTFNVLLNDVYFPPDDFSVTVDSLLPEGVTYLGNGLFAFEAYEGFTRVSFFYEICSNSCPDFCDMATVVIRPRITDCSFIPNIITPNEDGINDYFTIPCLDSGLFRDNTLVVYNQWGDKVFETAGYTNDPLTAWHGTLNNEPGKDLPDGVYFYVFKAGPNQPTQKGFVEIFR